MKKVVLSVVAALAVAGISAPAIAADAAVKAPKAPPPPPPYMLDIAVGGIVQSNYLFRGISQSNKGPSGGAYFEPDLTTPFGVFYVGIAGLSIDWPSGAGYGFTAPAAEIDLYGGWRHSWGPFSVDLGIVDYYYPSESWNGFTNDSDFYEIYGKVGWDFGHGLSVGGNVFWTPDLLNYSETFRSLGIINSPSATYASVTPKWVLPWTWGDLGAYVSGEYGHWWIESTGFVAAGLHDPSYNYWNAGLAFTYKQLTLDLRYHGNDLGETGCGDFLVTGVPNQSNSWCDDTFVVSLKFDTSVPVGHK